jgi:uncharacterized protein YndB with AHSA1/START domain
MITARTELTIERPADEVWSYAVDITRHPEWMNVTTAEVLRGTGAQVGDRGRERMRVGPLTRDADFTVVEAEPGRRIVWRAGGAAPFTGDLTLDLEPIGPMLTKAVYGGQFAFRGLLRFLEPLMAGEARQGPEKELRQLKAAVESMPANSASA